MDATGYSLARLRRWLRWLVPVAILTAIVVTIDRSSFVTTLTRTNPWIAVLGITLLPGRNVIAALRWRLLIRRAFGEPLTVGWTFRHYWTGLALGFFTPSSAGLDVYRIAVATRRLGRLAVNVALVLLEKGLALVGCTVLIVVVVPALPTLRDAQAGQLRQVWLGAMALLALGLLVLAAAGLLLRSRLADTLAAFAGRLVTRLAERVRSVSTATEEASPPAGWTNLLRPVLSPTWVGAVLAASLAILLASAVGNHVMFLATGHAVPFVVHLFVVPVLYVLFALPISFGSLGVREGAFIVLYGLFGVPAEVALLVSFLNLAGILLNNVIGAAVIAFHRQSAPERAHW